MLGIPRDELQTIDYDALIHSGEQAWLVEIDGRELWLPMSQCEIDEEAGTVEVPQWLCDEEDLHP